jgi:hypothetical protein
MTVNYIVAIAIIVNAMFHISFITYGMKMGLPAAGHIEPKTACPSAAAAVPETDFVNPSKSKKHKEFRS